MCAHLEAMRRSDGWMRNVRALFAHSAACQMLRAASHGKYLEAEQLAIMFKDSKVLVKEFFSLSRDEFLVVHQSVARMVRKNRQAKRVSMHPAREALYLWVLAQTSDARDRPHSHHKRMQELLEELHRRHHHSYFPTVIALVKLYLNKKVRVSAAA